MDKLRQAKAKRIFETWNPTAEQKLEQYVKLFPEQYAKVMESERAKIKGLNENDLYVLGRTFEKQIMAKKMNEEVTFAQLGATPTLAFDFITAMFGKSVIPYIASEQVLDEVQGLVYFENILATSNRGNLEKGDVLGRAAGVPDKYPQGYAGEMVYGEVVGPKGVIPSSHVLAHGPIRQNYVKIIAKAADGTVLTAVDDGKGNILGVGIRGEINYVNGEITNLVVDKELDTEVDVVANYATNFELGELPSITTELDSKFVRANVYGLQTDTSVISRYIMEKRFNFDMQQRAVQILQENILNEITTELLMKIEAAFAEIGETETIFDLTVPSGVSQQAHFNSVDFTFGVVAQKMAQRAGKGTLSVGLAGINACSFLNQNAKFKRIGEATAFATVYGVYDNATIIIRCPQLKDADAIYFLYKGATPFEAAAVYAPYMPLVGVEDLPVPTALLNRRSAVASMAAVDVLVPGFIQKFKVQSFPAFDGVVKG